MLNDDLIKSFITKKKTKFLSITKSSLKIISFLKIKCEFREWSLSSHSTSNNSPSNVKTAFFSQANPHTLVLQ